MIETVSTNFFLCQVLYGYHISVVHMCQHLQYIFTAVSFPSGFVYVDKGKLKLSPLFMYESASSVNFNTLIR